MNISGRGFIYSNSSAWVLAGGAATLNSSCAQRPKSVARQSLPQKGRYGLLGAYRDGFWQAGHVTHFSGGETGLVRVGSVGIDTQAQRVSSNEASSLAGCKRWSAPSRTNLTDTISRLPLISGISAKSLLIFRRSN